MVWQKTPHQVVCCILKIKLFARILENPVPNQLHHFPRLKLYCKNWSRNKWNFSISHCTIAEFSATRHVDATPVAWCRVWIVATEFLCLCCLKGSAAFSFLTLWTETHVQKTLTKEDRNRDSILTLRAQINLTTSLSPELSTISPCLLQHMELVQVSSLFRCK